MRYPVLCLAVAVVLGFALTAVAQTTQPAATQPATLFDPARHMRVADVRPGMKGYGLTVFSGDQIVPFDVEVVAVLKNFNPKYDAVLIRCPGEFLSHTGAIAGMSGSPIYLYPAGGANQKGTERMVGAFAYGWEMSKDCLAGVQPVEYMLRLPTDAPRRSTTEPSGAADASAAGDGPNWSMIELVRRSQPAPEMLSGDNKPGKTSNTNRPKRDTLTDLADSNPLLDDAKGNDDPFRPALRPLITPLMTAGMSPDVLKSLMPTLDKVGMVPLEAGGGSGDLSLPAPKLEPGSAFVVPLLTGDAEMSAIGTTTDVIGNRIFAFGHPFNNEGRMSLPLGSGRIDTVIPTLNESFKMGTLSAITGTLLTDETVGVAGQIGATPTMIPVTIHTIYDDGSENLDYHFNAAIHPLMTPMEIDGAVQAAVTGARGLPEHHTISFEATMEFANGRTLRLADRESDSGAAGVSSAIGLPLSIALSNPYQRVMLKQLDATVHVSNITRRAEIVNVTVPRQTYHPGETIHALITYQPYRGPEAVLPVDMPLPPSIPDGSYAFSVNDEPHYLISEIMIEPFKFATHNIRDVFDAVTDVTAIRHDALYLRLTRSQDGVAMGRVAMQQVPSSMRQVMLDDGRSDTTPFVSSDVRTVATDWNFQGSADFHITVDRRFKATTQP